MSQTINEVFLKKKPAKALVQVFSAEMHNNKIYASQLAKEIETTYSHTVHIITNLKDHGLVESTQDGRKKMLATTAKGAQLAKKLSKIINEPEYNEEL